MPPHPIITTPGEIEDWDAIIQSHPDHSVFHGREWMQTIAATYGYKPQCVLIRDADRTQVIPFFETCGLLGNRRAISLPYSDETEPLTHDQTSFDAIWNFLLKMGRERHWNYVELRGGEQFLKSAAINASYYTHNLDLQSDCESVRTNFSSAANRGIRKAEKSNVKVEHFQTFDSIKTYFNLHCLTRKKQGAPTQPFQFFENLYENLIKPGMGFITLAFEKAIPIAGAVFLIYGKKAFYKFGASNPNMLQNRPNNAVMWQAIKRLIKNGCQSLNFGRTDLHHEGLRKFKLGWGAIESKINYYRYSIAKNQFVPGTNKPGIIEQTLQTMIQWMPAWFGRAIGQWLYKYA